MSEMNTASPSVLGTTPLVSNTTQHDDTTPPSVDQFDILELLNVLIESEDPDKIKSLLANSTRANAYVTATRADKKNALHYMMSSRYPYPNSIVDLVISCAKNKQEYVASIDEDARTALHYAVQHRKFDIVDLLIHHAGEKEREYVAALDAHNRTALHYAAEQPEPDVVDRLINKAENKDDYIARRDKKYHTAIHIAVYMGHFEVVKRLTNFDQDKPRCINVKDISGYTALHIAVQNRSSDIVLHLLKQGTDPSITDRWGNTAWDLALSQTAMAGSLREDGDPQELGIIYEWEVIAAFILSRPAHPITRARNAKLKHSSVVKSDSLAEVYKALGPIAHSLEKTETGGNINTRTILARIIYQIHREFNENPVAHRDLISRDPSCIVQPLEYSNDEDRKPYIFVSLVVPFLYIDDFPVTETQTDLVVDDGRRNPCVGVRHPFPNGHTTLTLDEYCNSALPQGTLDARNLDQVLGRYTGASSQRSNSLQAPFSCGEIAIEFLNDLWVLMRAYVSKMRKRLDGQEPTQPVVDVPRRRRAIFVRQAWIWKISDDIIINLPSRIFFRFCPRSIWSGDSLSYALYVLRMIVKDFDNPSRGFFGDRFRADEPVLRTFENGLSIISESVNQYVKKARVEDMDLNIEKKLFHEIRDLREELSMIKSVLTEQEEVFDEFIGSVLPNEGHEQQPANRQCIKPRATTQSYSHRLRVRSKKIMGIGQRIKRRQSQRPRESAYEDVLWIQRMFDKRRRRMAKLEEDAERVERDVSTWLDLKQKHATMTEAHSLGILSAAVFGFTVITVIYTPLSFIAALFALPIDQFAEGKNGNKDGEYSSRYIGKWSVATELVSISVTLAAMWFALRFTGLHIWGNKGLREHIRQHARDLRAAEAASKKTGTDAMSRVWVWGEDWVTASTP